jgi:hypothetical protein
MKEFKTFREAMIAYYEANKEMIDEKFPNHKFRNLYK